MRDVMKLGLRLFLFTLIAALALAGTNAITSGPIAQQELAASQGAQRAVLPAAEIFEEQEIQAASEYDQITALYAGKAGDAVVGYVMTAAPQGYGGPIPITLGIGADGAIHGVSVGDLQETAGLGMKVGEEPFKSQFPGLAADPEEIDSKVQTISGATVSSRPFIAAVRQMVAYSKDVLGIEPNAATPALEGDDLVRKEYVASAEAFSALDVMSLIGDYGTIKSIYQGTVGDDAVGYVFELSSKGFADQIGLRMGITTDGVISKVVMTENNETEGYGTKTKEPSFTEQFTGKTATADAYMEGVEAVSGATVSSKAVFKAVGQAVDFYNTYLVAKEEPASAGDVYEVSGFGPMKIAIAVEDGKIASFEVVEHSETPGIGADLIEKGFDSLIGQDIQTASFDAVSGATVTSSAINEALKQAAEKNGAAAPAAEATPEAAQEPATVGEPVATYVGSGKGFGGDLTIEVSVDANDLIVSAAVVSHSETPDIGAPVAETGLNALVGQKVGEAQIDAVSGSTYTSDAINHALRNLYKKGEATPAPEAFQPRPTAVISTEGKAIATVAPENKQVPVQLAAASPVEAATQTPAATAAPALEAAEGKIYEVNGFAPMKIAITLEAGEITAFEVVEHGETPGFGADLIEKGFDSLIGQEIETASFDAVSGATMTSDAINAALKMAAEEVQE